MTCIVGLVAKETVYMGADSAGISGWALTHRKDRKVFKNGEFLIGGTESFRMLQILEHVFVPPKYNPKIDVYKYMVTNFVDVLRCCFKDSGFAKEDDKREVGGDFLVGFRRRLFRICTDYQVGESLDGYDAVGCGMDVAKGYLDASLAHIEGMLPKTRIELSLMSAQHHSAGVHPPFYVEKL